MQTCQKCLQENAEGDQFCVNCGESLQEKTPPLQTRFCKHCGKEVGNHVKFCPECGGNLTEDKSMDSQSSATTPLRSQSKKARSPLYNKWVIGGGLVAVLLIFGAYKWGAYYSEAAQIERISEKLTQQKYDELIPLMVRPNDLENYSATDAKPFVNTLKEDKTIADQVLRDVNQPFGSGTLVKILPSGRVGGIFKRYTMVVPSYRVDLTSNLKDGEISVDGTTKIKVESTDFNQRTAPLIYGTHTFELTGEKDKQQIQQKISTAIQKDVSVDLTVANINTTIVSNVNEADVYLNDKKVGVLTDGSYTLNDRLWINAMKFQLKRRLPDKTVEISDVYHLDDPTAYSDTVSLPFPDKVTDEEFTNFLDDFYNIVTASINYSYRTGLTSEGKNNLSRYFDGGKSNPEYLDFSEYINSVIKRIDDSKSDVQSQNIALNGIESFERQSQDTYKVTFTVTYDTEFSYSSGRDNLEEVFRYTGITLKKTDSDAGFKIIDMGGKEAMSKIN